MLATFTPTQTGPHKFTIASRNEGGLWFGRSKAKALRKRAIVFRGVDPDHSARNWDGESDPQMLVAGAQYFMRAMMKTQLSNDNLAIGVTLPDGVFLGPIPVSSPDSSNHTYLTTDLYEGSDSCRQCVAGRFDSDSDPTTACDFCPSGKWSTAVGAFVCGSGGTCLPGTYADDGSLSPSDCEMCSPGQHDDDNVSSSTCPRCVYPLLAAFSTDFTEYARRAGRILGPCALIALRADSRTRWA